MLKRFKVTPLDLLFLLVSIALCVLCMAGELLSVIDTTHLLRVGLEGFVIAASIFLIILKGDMNRRILLTYIWMILMIAITFNNSAWGFAATLRFITTLVVCAMVLRYDRMLDILLVCLSITCGIYAFCTIWFYFDSGFYMNHILPLYPEQRAQLLRWYNSGCMAGLTNHYSTNAMYVSVGLLTAFTYLRRKPKNAVIWIWTIFMGVALLLTGKRAHILFSAVAIVFGILMSLKSMNVQKKAITITAGSVIAIAAIAFAFIKFPALTKFIQRFQETMDSGNVSMGRFDLWKAAIEAFKNKPIFGIGWKQYKPTVSILLAKSRTYEVHNVYLQLLCETGIIGALVYYIWFVVMLVMAMKNIRDYANNDKGNGLVKCFFALIMQCFFLMYCLTGNPLYDSMMYMPYFVACGITINMANNLDVKTAKEDK